MNKKYIAIKPTFSVKKNTKPGISQDIIYEIVSPLLNNKSRVRPNELSIFAVDMVGEYICEIQPIMTSGQHSKIYEALKPMLQTDYGITNIAVVLPQENIIDPQPHPSEYLSSIEYLPIGTSPKTEQSLLLSFRVPATIIQETYSTHYKWDTSTDETSLSFAASQHKVISRMLISAVNPELNPAFLVLDPRKPYNVNDLIDVLGPTIILKSPTESRGKGLVVLHNPSQETFNLTLNSYGDPLILAETFIINTHPDHNNTKQTSTRYFVLFDGQTQEAKIFAKRADSAEHPLPANLSELTHKSSICHSSVLSDFEFVSDFSPNEKELILGEHLGNLMTSTTQSEIATLIENSSYKTELASLPDILNGFWRNIKLSNFYLNLGLSNSDIESLKKPIHQKNFVENYKSLLSNPRVNIYDPDAEQWVLLRWNILSIAFPHLTIKSLSSIFDSFVSISKSIRTDIANPKHLDTPHSNEIIKLYGYIAQTLVLQYNQLQH